VNSYYCNYVKRLLDVFVATAVLILTLPLLAIATAAVRMKLGSPVFFQQERPGLHAQPFRMVKLRTMTDERNAAGRLLTDDRRLTTLGRVLRATSIDELPELLNVLKGDMSLVGPRPLLTQYLERYSPEQARRHEVKPGITGLAQVSGRNALSWEEKFRLDVYYVDHCSFLLDLNIICRTFSKLVSREGITQPGHATAEEFKGGVAL
jgi:lipopolysaccharide/colanic/teichoic acid biosynthesis glycosyltransferase